MGDSKVNTNQPKSKAEMKEMARKKARWWFIGHPMSLQIINNGNYNLWKLRKKVEGADEAYD